MTKKWWIASIISIILVLLAVALIVMLFHSPSQSIIKQPDQVNTVSQNESPTPIDTAYFTAKLPPGFTIRTQEENATRQDVMQIVATKVNSNGQQIAINVATIGGDGLSGVASYNLRAKNPSVYTPVSFGGMPTGVPTFNSQTTSTYEVTGFWPRAGLYASISVSGAPNDNTAINGLYLQVLDSWQWR